MRTLMRAIVEGCLGLGIVVVAVLLHLALRGALRRQDRLLALAAPAENNFVSGRSEKLRRPFFLPHSDES
jgi:hypothetical protein